MYEKKFQGKPIFFTFDGLDNEASCGEERMNITVYIQTWWALTSNNIPTPWVRKIWWKYHFFHKNIVSTITSVIVWWINPTRWQPLAVIGILLHSLSWQKLNLRARTWKFLTVCKCEYGDKYARIIWGAFGNMGDWLVAPWYMQPLSLPKSFKDWGFLCGNAKVFTMFRRLLNCCYYKIFLNTYSLLPSFKDW